MARLGLDVLLDVAEEEDLGLRHHAVKCSILNSWMRYSVNRVASNTDRKLFFCWIEIPGAS